MNFQPMQHFLMLLLRDLSTQIPSPFHEGINVRFLRILPKVIIAE